MANKRDASKKQVAAWVHEDIIAKLDELVEIQQKKQGKHFPYHRSDAVKMVLEEQLDAYIANMRKRNNAKKN